MLFVIFGISSFIQWEHSQEIKLVSEYHRNMSIPSISMLSKIELNFQMIYMLSVEMIQTNPTDEKYLEFQEGYLFDRDVIDTELKKYGELSFSENSRGELLASPKMQTQMQNNVVSMQQLIQNNDVIIQQYQNGQISGIDAMPLLVSIENDFREIMDTTVKMEIRGMENTQSQIMTIEDEMGKTLAITTIIAVVIAIIVVVLTSKFVSIPINRLIEVTKKIANREIVEVESKSKNSDVNDMLISLGKMSKDLKDYESRILKQEKLSSIGELASRLAHDIRNPLTIIKVSLDIMKAKDNLTEEELKKFQRVDEAMYRITHQIDNVLDFVKGRPLKISKHSLQDILKSVILDLTESKKVQITNEDMEINCDFELMKVVLINLVVNAMQATGNEGKIKINKDHLRKNR
jgi:nitrogen fixation/metabolism regulation signal transduction histidine kinase